MIEIVATIFMITKIVIRKIVYKNVVLLQEAFLVVRRSKSEKKL